MAVVGSLLIEMSANMARLQKDMAAARSTVNTATAGINSAINTTKNLLGTLGIAFGAVQGARFLKGIIDTQDELSKLSQKLDISVEQLAGLRHAADLAGVSGEGLTKGFKTLSTQMFDASRGLIESQRNFAALGIEVKNADGTLRGTQAVMLQVADRFAGMRDGAEKSALAVKLFGKAGLDMIPLLNEGSAAIANMIAEGQRLNPVTAESAKQAEIFNDNMKRVGATLKGGFISAMNKVLPGISDISKAMADAAKEAGFWQAALVGLGGAIDKIFAMPALQKANKEFFELTERLLDLQNARDRTAAGGFPALLPALDAQIAKTNLRLADLQKIRDALSMPSPDQPKPQRGGITDIDPAAAEKAAKDRLAMLEKYRQMDAAGWVKYIEATTSEYEDGLRAQAKINDESWKEKDRLRNADQAAMFAMIDAEQDAAIAMGAVLTQGISEQSKLWMKAADEVSEAWKTAAKDMQRGMSSFFFDVMQGKLSDLSGSFKRTIDKMVADALAAKAAVALFGNGFSSGGSMGGLVGAALGAFGFGGGGGNASLAADIATGIGFPEYATGTNYVPRTGLALVHKGEEIIPAGESRGGRGITIIQNFAPGTDRATVNQAAARAGEAVQRAMARNT